MMMDYNSMNQGMMSGNAGMTMTLMWLTYILVVVALVLGIAALWKYLTK